MEENVRGRAGRENVRGYVRGYTYSMASLNLSSNVLISS